jgi:hypothetical protein
VIGTPSTNTTPELLGVELTTTVMFDCVSEPVVVVLVDVTVTFSAVVVLVLLVRL